MKLGIIIYSNDPETVWNAFRLANTALGYDDQVTVFLLGKGVECRSIRSVRYNIEEQMDLFAELGGTLIGCGVCCEAREETMPLLQEDLQCDMGSMQDLYAITQAFDKLLTF